MKRKWLKFRTYCTTIKRIMNCGLRTLHSCQIEITLTSLYMKDNMSFIINGELHFFVLCTFITPCTSMKLHLYDTAVGECVRMCTQISRSCFTCHSSSGALLQLDFFTTQKGESPRRLLGYNFTFNICLPMNFFWPFYFLFKPSTPHSEFASRKSSLYVSSGKQRSKKTPPPSAIPIEQKFPKVSCGDWSISRYSSQLHVFSVRYRK